jgi:uncharacterized protein
MLDRAGLEGSSKVTLRDAPIEKSWITEGRPIARNAVLAQSADRSTTTILWECSDGAFAWHYTFDETIYFLEGSVTIQRRGEKPRTYGPGDFIHFSVGDSAQWTVHGRIRKVAFCRNPPPMPVAVALRASRGLARRFRAMTGTVGAPSLADA